MAKRSAPLRDGEDQPRKRYKPAGPVKRDLGIEAAEVEEIQSGEQLQKLLTLQQDAPARLLHGLLQAHVKRRSC